jgi:hypothetical protein
VQGFPAFVLPSHRVVRFISVQSPCEEPVPLAATEYAMAPASPASRAVTMTAMREPLRARSVTRQSFVSFITCLPC